MAMAKERSINKMRIKSKTAYYKKSRKGKSPATYKARQPRGKGTTVHAKVRLDPVLKGMPKERKLIMLHEQNELRAWAKGMSRDKASRLAKRATKKDDHFDTKSEFWGLVKRRKQ